MADLPPPPYAAVSPKSLPRLEALPYEVLVRILQLSTTRYVHPTDRHAAVWWLVREVRLVSRTLRDGACLPVAIRDISWALLSYVTYI